MTLFTKEDCSLCGQLKQQFDLSAMNVKVEVLTQDDSDALAHLAWHSLVETARKSLPILVLDDSSTIADYKNIEHHLAARADQHGVSFSITPGGQGCESGSCSF